MRRWVVSLFVGVAVSGCFRTPEPKSQAPAEAPPAVAKPKPPARDADLLRITKLAAQADQVQREAWWVVSGERRPAPKSAFGKLSRAALWALDGKLATKGVFNCDQYRFAKDAGAGPWAGTFSEKCGERSPEKKLAVWRDTGPKSARVEFFPANLGEVLGLGASIFGKPLACELTWTENGILSTLSCPGWEQDRNHQMIRLDVYEYKREQGAILKLKGKVLENLLPVRKIESEVPLEGKITVTETELNPPEPEPAKPAAPPEPPKHGPKNAEGTAAAAENGAAPDSAGAAPVDADLFKRQARKVRIDAPAATPDGEPAVSLPEEPAHGGQAPVLEPTPMEQAPMEPGPVDPAQMPGGTSFGPAPTMPIGPDGQPMSPMQEAPVLQNSEPDYIPEGLPSNR